MQIPRDAVLLRIFFGENDRHQQQPLYEAVVLKAREMHLGGATVLRGAMGFGHSSRLHTAKIMRLSFDLPIVVEIVDTEAKVMDFLPVLDEMMSSGLITLEKVQVLQYGTEGFEAAGGAGLNIGLVSKADSAKSLLRVDEITPWISASPRSSEALSPTSGWTGRSVWRTLANPLREGIPAR